MSNPVTIDQVAALRAAGINELYRIRSGAMRSVTKELEETIQQAQATPDSLPVWSFARYLSSVSQECNPTAPGFWELLRAHMAAKTALQMASMEISKGVTGLSLSAHIGVDLYALALDGWEGMTSLGLSLAGEMPNV